MGKAIASKGDLNAASVTSDKSQNKYIFINPGQLTRVKNGEFIIPIIKTAFGMSIVDVLRQLFARVKTTEDFLQALTEVEEQVILVKVKLDPPQVWINGLPQQILSPRSEKISDAPRDIESLKRNAIFLKCLISRHDTDVHHSEWLVKVYPSIKLPKQKDKILEDNSIELKVRRLFDEKLFLFTRALGDEKLAETILKKTSTHVRLNTVLPT